jgi:signal transduction histidine kinase
VGGRLAGPNSRWSRYLLAVAAVAAALVLRYLLNPILGSQGPYLILTLAIVVPALYAGFGPALFATILGTLVGTYLFIGSGHFAIALEPANAARTLLFLAIGASISVIGGQLRKSRLELTSTVRQLHASNRAKDDALAIVGHEIRNPLAALHTAQELLSRSKGDPGVVARVGDVFQRQVAQMARMADDLLDLSSITRGEVVIRRVPVDLHAVLLQALEQTTPLMTRKRHRLRHGLGTTPVQVMGDASRLVQVFANLLMNAAKYTKDEGQIELALHPAEPGFVAVSIADNGGGMDPDTISDLFEPFVQAPGAATNQERGLGLGLAIVRKIVELHGGSVQAHSAGLGLGSEVTVRLPVAAA